MIPFGPAVIRVLPSFRDNSPIFGIWVSGNPLIPALFSKTRWQRLVTVTKRDKRYALFRICARADALGHDPDPARRLFVTWRYCIVTDCDTT
jgi:hypothetical protein